MRKILLLAIILLTHSYSEAHIFIGKVIDSASKEPLPYASIGIVDKNIGKVSDESGDFTIDLYSQFDQDTLMISMIGYNSFKLLVKEFKEEYSIKKAHRIK